MGTGRLAVIKEFVPLFGTTTIITLVLSLNGMTRRAFFTSRTLSCGCSTCGSACSSPRITCGRISSTLVVLSRNVGGSRSRIMESDMGIRPIHIVGRWGGRRHSFGILSNVTIYNYFNPKLYFAFRN